MLNNYNKMSDFEINIIIAGIMFTGGSVHSIKQAHCSSSAVAIHFHNLNTVMKFDPCNSPADAWAIITDSDIELTRHRINGYKTGDYKASGMYHICTDWNSIDGYNEVSVIDKNPMRAIMICYLMMKDKEDA